MKKNLVYSRNRLELHQWTRNQTFDSLSRNITEYGSNLIQKIAPAILPEERYLLHFTTRVFVQISLQVDSLLLSTADTNQQRQLVNVIFIRPELCKSKKIHLQWFSDPNPRQQIQKHSAEESELLKKNLSKRRAVNKRVAALARSHEDVELTSSLVASGKLTESLRPVSQESGTFEETMYPFEGAMGAIDETMSSFEGTVDPSAGEDYTPQIPLKSESDSLKSSPHEASDQDNNELHDTVHFKEEEGHETTDENFRSKSSIQSKTSTKSLESSSVLNTNTAFDLRSVNEITDNRENRDLPNMHQQQMQRGDQQFLFISQQEQESKAKSENYPTEATKETQTKGRPLELQLVKNEVLFSFGWIAYMITNSTKHFNEYIILKELFEYFGQKIASLEEEIISLKRDYKNCRNNLKETKIKSENQAIRYQILASDNESLGKQFTTAREEWDKMRLKSERLTEELQHRDFRIQQLESLVDVRFGSDQPQGN